MGSIGGDPDPDPDPGSARSDPRSRIGSPTSRYLQYHEIIVDSLPAAENLSPPKVR